MKGYKDREVRTQKSKVYYNLHKHMFSVKQSGLVVLHAEGVKLVNAHFQVSEAGRQRVIKEKRKNVHAYVNGIFQGVITEADIEGYKEATYNPYKYNSFIDKHTGHKLHEAREVILLNKKIYYI